MSEKKYFYDTSVLIEFQFKQYEEHEYNPKKIRTEQKLIKAVITPQIVQELVHVYYKKKNHQGSAFYKVDLDKLLKKIDTNYLTEKNTNSQSYADFRSILSRLDEKKHIRYKGSSGRYKGIGPQDVYHLVDAINTNCNKFITFERAFQKTCDLLEDINFPEIVTLENK